MTVPVAAGDIRDHPRRSVFVVGPAVFAGLGSSQDQFDRWFREMAHDIHGINLEDGFPPPEQLIDYRPAPIGAGAGPN